MKRSTLGSSGPDKASAVGTCSLPSWSPGPLVSQQDGPRSLPSHTPSSPALLRAPRGGPGLQSRGSMVEPLELLLGPHGEREAGHRLRSPSFRQRRSISEQQRPHPLQETRQASRRRGFQADLKGEELPGEDSTQAWECGMGAMRSTCGRRDWKGSRAAGSRAACSRVRFLGVLT